MHQQQPQPQRPTNLTQALVCPFAAPPPRLVERSCKVPGRFLGHVGL
jgi:hypothetical protein